VGLLKKKKKKKTTVARFSGGGGSGSEISSQRPQAVDKLPPCVGECPSGNDVRGWLTVIAQRDKRGLSLEEACDQAWMIEVETNPFPGVMGRVCPHPCETACNRTHKDEAVAINSVERFIGDWGMERGLKLPTADAGGPFDEKIAVVGAGPSGLSCAYQLARRGYKVTVFDAFDKPGGMLRFGIPPYRLPREVLDGEIQRILDMGVELKTGTSVGANGVTLEDLRKQYDAVFVGIGAHKGKTMGIPGEDGPGVYTGTDFLNRANSGRDVEIGKKVVVIGGGDTAIDAARVSLRLGPDAAAVSRRLGAEVTILYRRTRAEMPAIEREIEEALEEGIKIEFLAAPVKCLRDADGKLSKLAVQRMELGEPDDSGRRRPVPIEGDVYETEADTLVMAVSQAPDWGTLGGGIEVKGNWLEVDEWGRTGMDGVWSGGDTLTLGLATISIGQGRKAAECIHATLHGKEPENPPAKPPIGKDGLQLDWYEAKPAAKREVLAPEVRVGKPAEEMDLGITREQALEETTRCFSCGLCFGCENCWMYCQNNCFKKTKELKPGHYYDIDLSTCDGCKKCAEECPCGFLELY
jgi:NADPH-dependent glutamate synthase beta subunit-like oxidoreductase/Pyruvate/2-oxoacid:ferredoxin oxidoreductase delta subunit